MDFSIQVMTGAFTKTEQITNMDDGAETETNASILGCLSISGHACVTPKAVAHVSGEHAVTSPHR